MDCASTLVKAEMPTTPSLPTIANSEPWPSASSQRSETMQSIGNTTRAPGSLGELMGFPRFNGRISE